MDFNLLPKSIIAYQRNPKNKLQWKISYWLDFIDNIYIICVCVCVCVCVCIEWMGGDLE